MAHPFDRIIEMFPWSISSVMSIAVQPVFYLDVLSSFRENGLQQDVTGRSEMVSRVLLNQSRSWLQETQRQQNQEGKGQRAAPAKQVMMESQVQCITLINKNKVSCSSCKGTVTMCRRCGTGGCCNRCYTFHRIIGQTINYTFYEYYFVLTC